MTARRWRKRLIRMLFSFVLLGGFAVEFGHALSCRFQHRVSWLVSYARLLTNSGRSVPIVDTIFGTFVTRRFTLFHAIFRTRCDFGWAQIVLMQLFRAGMSSQRQLKRLVDSSWPRCFTMLQTTLYRVACRRYEDHGVFQLSAGQYTRLIHGNLGQRSVQWLVIRELSGVECFKILSIVIRVTCIFLSVVEQHCFVWVNFI